MQFLLFNSNGWHLNLIQSGSFSIVGSPINIMELFIECYIYEYDKCIFVFSRYIIHYCFQIVYLIIVMDFSKSLEIGFQMISTDSMHLNRFWREFKTAVLEHHKYAMKIKTYYKRVTMTS